MSLVIIIWASLLAILSYLLGSIPFSYLVAKSYGKNLYRIGSGNIGTANVYRATGKLGPVILALTGDVGKGVLAISLAQKFSCCCFINYLFWAESIAALFVVLGHNWPIFLKFKGGRGLATLAGVILFLNWKAILLVVGVIIFSILLVELIGRRSAIYRIPFAITKKKIKLEGSFKKRSKTLLSIIISQIVGRVIGILAAAILIFILYPQLFKIALLPTVLTGIKHIKRTKDFVKGQK